MTTDNSFFSRHWWRMATLLLASSSLSYGVSLLADEFFQKPKPTTHAASLVPLEPEQQESDLEKAVKECDFDTRW
ncbi:MAG: hypothetical protein AABX37_01420, partial [Nanoarchaeota archaeon]